MSKRFDLEDSIYESEPSDKEKTKFQSESENSKFIAFEKSNERQSPKIVASQPFLASQESVEISSIAGSENMEHTNFKMRDRNIMEESGPLNWSKSQFSAEKQMSQMLEIKYPTMEKSMTTKQNSIGLSELLKQQSSNPEQEPVFVLQVQGPTWRSIKTSENSSTIEILKAAGGSGHYEFHIQSYKTFESKGDFSFSQAVKQEEFISVDRRYSDFDLFRKALCCLYPGTFVPLIPPKEAFAMFKKEDSESIRNRKTGILQFLKAVGSHDILSKPKETKQVFIQQQHNQNETNSESIQSINPFEDFLWLKSTHQFDKFKEFLQTTIQQRGSFVFGPIYNQQQTKNDKIGEIGEKLSNLILKGQNHQKIELNLIGSHPIICELNEFNNLERYLNTLQELYQQLIDQLKITLDTMIEISENYNNLANGFINLRQVRGVVGLESQPSVSHTQAIDEINNSLTGLRDLYRHDTIENYKQVWQKAIWSREWCNAGLQALLRFKAIVTSKHLLSHKLDKIKNSAHSKANADAEYTQMTDQLEFIESILAQTKSNLMREHINLKSRAKKKAQELIVQVQTVQKQCAQHEQFQWKRCLQSNNFQQLEKQLVQGLANSRKHVQQKVQQQEAFESKETAESELNKSISINNLILD